MSREERYSISDISRVFDIDIRVVAKTIEALGLKAPFTLEEAKAVRAAIPETKAKTEIERLLDKLPEWVVKALIAVYERAYADGQRVAIAKKIRPKGRSNE